MQSLSTNALPENFQPPIFTATSVSNPVLLLPMRHYYGFNFKLQFLEVLINLRETDNTVGMLSHVNKNS